MNKIWQKIKPERHHAWPRGWIDYGSSSVLLRWFLFSTSWVFISLVSSYNGLFTIRTWFKYAIFGGVNIVYKDWILKEYILLNRGSLLETMPSCYRKVMQLTGMNEEKDTVVGIKICLLYATESSLKTGRLEVSHPITFQSGQRWTDCRCTFWTRTVLRSLISNRRDYRIRA